MKVLLIMNDGKNDKGYFINPTKYDSTNPNNSLQGIDTITKEDILDIIEYMIDNDIEYDEYQEGRLQNPAQDTIYKSLYLKLKNLQDSKSIIINEIDAKFKDAENKYS